MTLDLGMVIYTNILRGMLMTTRSRVLDSHHKFSSAGLKYPYQQDWKMVRPCEQAAPPHTTH